MYIPPHFEENDSAILHALIRAHPFGLLVSSSPDDVQANPAPFVLKVSGATAHLQLHLARANPQWRHIQSGASCLVIFQGVDSYITPSWYASKAEHGKVVPTWNYAMVQARGAATIHDDPTWLHQQITALTNSQEDGRDLPWRVSDAPEKYIHAQMRGIVGINIEIESLKGKWKVSQNRSEADQQGVSAGLVDEGDADMASMVQQRGKKGP